MSEQTSPPVMLPEEVLPEGESAPTLGSYGQPLHSATRPQPADSSDTRPLVAYHWQCPRCGGTDLAAAYLVDYSMDKFRQLKLAPKALKLNKISRMFRPFKRMINVSAQVCRQCGAVTLEVDPEELQEAEERYGRR